MLPQSNAVLERVERTEGTTGGGFSEDWDRPATDPESAGGEGADLWTGGVEAYYIEHRQRLQGGQDRDLIQSRTVIVDRRRPEIAFKEGDTVTLDFAGTTIRGRVRVVESHRLAGVANYTRLTLEDA